MEVHCDRAQKSRLRAALVRAVCFFCLFPLALAMQPDARAQQNPVTVLYTLYPYDGNQPADLQFNLIPRDVTKIAYGVTPAELCAKRTAAEIEGPVWQLHPLGPVLFVGIVVQSVGDCGFIWENLTAGVPAQTAVFLGDSVTCPSLAGLPLGAPPPPQCFRVGSPKNPGPPPCPCPNVGPRPCLCLKTGKNGAPLCPCGNPINAGTGNKFQAETDLQEPGAGSLSFERYYNSGMEAYDGRLGGHWQHTYSRRILTDGGTHATYYQADGKQLVFTLQGSTWTS